MDMRDAVTLRPLRSAPAHRLGEWAATAIRGNDITSSSFYVAALYMFIGSPSDRFPYKIAELGGVRLII